MDPSMLTELAHERINDRRREAARLRAVELTRSSPVPRSPWRVVLGARLIEWGCRLWLSGNRGGPEPPPPPAARFVPPPREAA